MVAHPRKWSRSGTVQERIQAVVALVVSLFMALSPAVSFAQAPKPTRIFQDAVLDSFVPVPLNWVNVPEPSTLGLFVADRAAAVRLGKALFWDMSVGSTGTQACATCHFHAGADARERNQLNAGGNGIFELGMPNYTVVPADFPLTDFADVNNRFSPRTRDIRDVLGSQGVPFSAHVGVAPGVPVDDTALIPDAVFHAPDGAGMPLNTRRVTGRNTPSVINAVFNLRNFWDGRAAAGFNGVSPFGQHDPAAQVWTVDASGQPSLTSILMELSSLAAQAVGPVLNDTEMSAAGRQWADMGRKLLTARPLQQQAVDATDSVLGGMAAPGAGLTGTYADMVRAAFLPTWWDSAVPVVVNGGLYSVMEANFSLFFGLAVQMYESTLISDNAKFDQARRGDIGPGGVPVTLTANEKRGLEIFSNIGQNPNPDIPIAFCAICHLGSEFTGAAVSQVGLAPLVLPGAIAAPEFLVERMQSGAILDMGRLVMSSNPLPDQLPFPAGFSLNPANSPLTGLIEVRPAPGDPTARGTYKSAFGDKLTQPIVMNLALEPKPEAITDPAVDATLTVGNDGSIGLEILTFNMVPGVYQVLAGGVVLGTLTAVPNVLYDLGFYNVGVTRTTDDLGLGAPGVNPDGTPLGMSAQRLLGLPEPFIRAGVPEVINIVTGRPMTLEAPIATDRPLVDGSFKVPSLRNAELTAPYFHNGGKRTLCEVVDFYNRGADFHAENAMDLAPTIQNLGMTDQDKADVVAFLLTLTDERVRHERAPFDHPQLFVPDGHLGSDALVFDADGDGNADDGWMVLPAVGAAGGPAIADFLGGGAGTCLAAAPAPEIPAPVPAPAPDTTAPVVTAPAAITVPAMDGTGTPASNGVIAAFLNGATATDNVGVVSLTHNAPNPLPLGVTTVTFTASDAAGNIGTATSTVTVTDQTAPVVTVPAPLTLVAADPAGIPISDPAIVAFLASASAADNVDGAVEVTNNAPPTFPVGTTTVIFSATDLAGNPGSAGATVTVTLPSAQINTPLHDAVIAGNKGLVETLIGGGASADAQGVDVRTPLHLAAMANNKEIVGILLKAVTRINTVDVFGHTALFYATNQEVQKKLIESGAIAL
ncbi:MAG: ankyrin repeat domain-containing protein [Nitrospirota bacterium]|nr:ankyrin repeat domain-containing protein [Nitrospirota bacterium]